MSGDACDVIWRGPGSKPAAPITGANDPADRIALAPAMTAGFIVTNHASQAVAVGVAA